MSKVINKSTFKIIEFANTPDYMDGNWIINPTIPSCDKRYWKILNNDIVEMSPEEKNMVNYKTLSTIYLIEEKQLLQNQNGVEFENNINAIINPLMPSCDIKYTKVVDNKVIEMTTDEKLIVDKPDVERINSKINVSELYNQAITDLELIQSIANPTTAQLIWAIKREALIIERLLKFIKLNIM